MHRTKACARLQEKGEEREMDEWNLNRKQDTLGWSFSSHAAVHSKTHRDTEGTVTAQQGACGAHGDVPSYSCGVLTCDAPWGWRILMVLQWIPCVSRVGGSIGTKQGITQQWFRELGSRVSTRISLCFPRSLLWRTNKAMACIELLNPGRSSGFEIRTLFT